VDRKDGLATASLGAALLPSPLGEARGTAAVALTELARLCAASGWPLVPAGSRGVRVLPSSPETGAFG
jgi:hypothetical protein